jgi:oligoribonuclease
VTAEALFPWVWVDLEMTGLDPASCVILEAAVVVTDSELRTLGSCEEVLHATETELAVMVPVVREMHTRSGLAERALQSRVTVEQAEARMLALVQGLSAPRTAILCGNSVWQDRRFLERYMPRFLQHLHYRMIDVSSLKVLVKTWRPDGALDKGEKAHTAMADIRASIAELGHYRQLLFGSGGTR